SLPRESHESRKRSCALGSLFPASPLQVSFSARQRSTLQDQLTRLAPKRKHDPVSLVPDIFLATSMLCPRPKLTRTALDLFRRSDPQIQRNYCVASTNHHAFLNVRLRRLLPKVRR